MIKNLLVASAIAFTSAASAGTLLSGFATHHFQGSGWCENNYGIGYRNNSGWATGYYKNSDCKDSFYVAKEFQFKHSKNLSTGILLGVVSGYSQQKIIPVALPELVLKHEQIELAFLVNPVKFKNIPQFVAVQLRWKFK